MALMDTDFMTERHFTPLVTLREYGKEVRERMISSELDLGYFERQTVESPVASVIKQLHANPRFRRVFRLNGNVIFENHANTLADERDIVPDMSALSLTQKQPRRSNRLAANSRSVGLATHQPGRSQAATQSRNSRPRADQFCVYNKGSGIKQPAFIIEYKAPHKVSLAHVKAGLQDMDLNEVLRYKDVESPEEICRRVIAAVITQTFSYMVQGGLEYGYVCTGEALIFLRVLRNDPSTVYYYLSVPGEDVGASTGWTGDLDGGNRLHLTALGQVLAFTLRALPVPTRDIGWTNWARRKLETWVMVYDEILDKTPEENIPSFVFKPPTQSRSEYCRASPVKTRSKTGHALSCHGFQNPTLSDRDDDDAGGDFDPTTPSRPPRERPRTHPPSTLSSPSPVQSSQDSGSQGKSRQYCTQRCLQGLIKGWKLDEKCPNVSDHGVDRHQLNRTTLLRRLGRQLSRDDLQSDTQLGCESLHVHGTRGALFKITLWSHGYTFVGKGVPMEFVRDVKHEELIYSHLAPIQGVCVPALLGSLQLRRPFSYDGIADIVRLMLMGYAGGKPAWRHNTDRDRLIQRAGDSLQAIHDLGILHGDPIPGNLIWSEENDGVMFIDFERATLPTRRVPLEGISPNKDRIREAHLCKSPSKRVERFEREKQRMRHEL
ncbi:uncharacterized protein BDW47DRAFT_104322 [Aspergillus candidus]|uniref:Aminoglycoside phosphotransferase domain-containing protein n=1 Tax=Aspergillus candidus TaxID=41067 RepID=A0A2I2FDT0_ASPCN|nr:hypothetical protein BDW47DRAFT_104322 [Aspergillus candidus]PLB38800.1 hypothetical protein BDW47DRAFT_104322 [Aspergillus candidus]